MIEKDSFIYIYIYTCGFCGKINNLPIIFEIMKSNKYLLYKIKNTLKFHLTLAPSILTKTEIIC